ncbi:MAG: PVC-type heme-binding CxxCH protein, partial [Pirellulaceae bacterium]
MLSRSFKTSYRQRDRFAGMLGIFLVSVSAGWLPLLAADPVKLPDSPVAAQDSLQYLQLAPGLRAELVASEPQVTDPVAVRFDARGRMWVVEMRDYPWGPGKGEVPQCQLRILTDEDGDGYFETSRLFADQLLFTTGIQPWKDGVIVTMAGQVAYFKDTTGDGWADLRQIWYQGFVEDNSQLRANHPRFALDNHIYIANGLRGGVVQDARRADSPRVNINNMDFRFHPQSFQYEAVSGVGQFGLTFDNDGNRFVCSNRNPVKHVVLKNRYLQRSPTAAISAVYHDAAAAGEASRIFPIGRSWTTSTLHAGQFTAACGVFCYRGNALPAEFHGNVFTCDPTGSLVHREIMTPRGGTFSGRRGRDGVEFLASRDEWFRPVNMELGPDGAMYVVDMYRAVIEHPRWVPAELKERPDTRFGDNRGRIYRITAVRAPAAKQARDYSQASNVQLVQLLAHDNAWQREVAARLIMERKPADPTALVRSLEKLARDGKTPHARIHALWSLQGQEKLAPETIAQGLQDDDAHVRRQAVVLAESRLANDPVLRQQVVDLATDSNAQVRFQVALSLTPIRNDHELQQVGQVLLRSKGDVWTRRAVRLAVASRVADLLLLTLEQPLPKDLGSYRQTILELVEAAGRRTSEQQLKTLLVRLIAQSDQPLQFGSLQALLRSMASRRISPAKLLGDDASSLAPVFARADRVAGDSAARLSDRILAIGLVSYASAMPASLVGLCQPGQPQAIRLAALNSLARRSEVTPWPALLDRFASESPVIRRTLLDAALRNAQRTGLLLDRIEA